MRRIFAVLLFASLGAWSGAEAGSNQGAAILIGAGPVTPTTSCETLQRSDCFLGDPSYDSPGGPNNFVAIYVGSAQPRLLDMMAVDFGIIYGSALRLVSWHCCGDLEFVTGEWPLSESGDSVVWATPQTGPVVLVGWFQIDVDRSSTAWHAWFFLEPHPDFGGPRITDWQNNMDILLSPASANLFGDPGSNPSVCVPTPVRSESWGRIKALYGR